MNDRSSRQVASGRRREHFDGEPRDGGHCFEEAPDKVLAIGDQRVAESFQDEGGEVDEISLGESNVLHEFIGVRLVVQQLCDSPVAWAEHRDNTKVDLEVQLLASMLSDSLW